jgi:hypothetical protein
MAQGDPNFALPRYQVYDTDSEPRFARIAGGQPRGAALQKTTRKTTP